MSATTPASPRAMAPAAKPFTFGIAADPAAGANAVRDPRRYSNALPTLQAKATRRLDAS